MRGRFARAGERRGGELDLLTFTGLGVDLDHHSAISNTVHGENQTDEGAPLTCKEPEIGWKVNGTRVDDSLGMEGPRNPVGEDDGAAILVTDFNRLLREGTGGVVVAGVLFSPFAVEDVRVWEVGVVEIRRFLYCCIGVPSFSLSELISTRPNGGGRPAFVKAGSNFLY